MATKDQSPMTRADMTNKADSLLAKAFVATEEILDDKTAATTSRASAVSSALAIFRELKGEAGSRGKDPSEMTADELADELARLRAAAAGGAETTTSDPFD